MEQPQRVLPGAAEGHAEAPDQQHQEEAWQQLGGTGSLLTAALLVLGRLQQVLELHVDVDLHPQQQRHLQQHQLQLADTCRWRGWP